MKTKSLTVAAAFLLLCSAHAEEVPRPQMSRQSIRNAQTYCKPTGLSAPQAICKTTPWQETFNDRLVLEELSNPMLYSADLGNWLDAIVINPAMRGSDPPQIVDGTVVISQSDCSTEVADGSEGKESMAPSHKGSSAWKFAFRKCVRDNASRSLSLLRSNLAFQEQLYDLDPGSPFLEALEFVSSPSHSLELRGPRTSCYWEMTEGVVPPDAASQRLAAEKARLRQADEAEDRRERERVVLARICNMTWFKEYQDPNQCIENALKHPIDESFQRMMTELEKYGLEPDEEACTATDSSGYVYDAESSVLDFTQFLVGKTLKMISGGAEARYATETEKTPMMGALFALACNGVKSYQYYIDHPNEMPESDDIPAYMLFDHDEQRPAYSLATDAFAEAFFGFYDLMTSLQSSERE